MTTLRIAVIFGNFGPYHIARLAAAARHCDLLAIEVASVRSVYAWQPTSDVPFQRQTLFQVKGEDKDWKELVKRLTAALDAYRPDVVVIPGWGFVEAAAALRWAATQRIPVVVMSDSQEIDFPRTRIKEWIKCRYLRLCQTALVGGTSHRAYLESLGMPAECIWNGYDVVDNDYFATGADDARSMAERLRRQHGLPERYFLASARFVPKKNLHRLIRAYGDYRRAATGSAGDRNNCWDLVLLGDGELRTELEDLIHQLILDDVVYLPGFKQYAELPLCYSLASGFIQASSTEQWGLVVNEAMAAGLPVLVSKRCGCAVDLVEIGRNGFTFDPHSQAEIKRLLLLLASDGIDRAVMGEASRRIIERWSPELFARNLVAAAKAAMALPTRRVFPVDRLLMAALIRR